MTIYVGMEKDWALSLFGGEVSQSQQQVSILGLSALQRTQSTVVPRIIEGKWTYAGKGIQPWATWVG
jgi:hypothetical protein